MTDQTHSAFIALPGGGNAFIDGIPDTCDHDSKGDVIYKAISGKVIYWHTYREWAHLDTKQREALIFKRHQELEDPIIEGMSSCSKCKKPFQPPMF